MKHIRYALMAAVALAAVVFAIANRATASVDLWPLPLILDLPVYILGLGGVAVGFLVGVFLTGIRALGWRMKAADRLRRAERAESRADTLDAKVKDLETKMSDGPVTPTPALPSPDAALPAPGQSSNAA